MHCYFKYICSLIMHSFIHCHYCCKNNNTVVAFIYICIYIIYYKSLSSMYMKKGEKILYTNAKAKSQKMIIFISFYINYCNTNLKGGKNQHNMINNIYNKINLFSNKKIVDVTWRNLPWQNLHGF